MTEPHSARRHASIAERPAPREWQGHFGPLLDSVNGFDVIDCGRCEFKHILPIPDVNDLEGIYRHDYYAKEKPLYLEGARRDLDWWNLVYAERYALFEDLLPASRRRLVEIGSGPGFFLLQGLTRGWQPLGVEPSAQAASHSRSLGLEVIEDFFSRETAERLDKCDVVQMTDVLEHLPDPRATLELAHGLLAPGGLLCVVVPNDYNPFQTALRQTCGFRPWWVAPPHHINYFDFESLSSLLCSSGFEIVSSEATFPIDLFLMMGDDYVDDRELGRACHEKRMRFEQRMASAGLSRLKRSLYEALAAHGLGREAVLVGRKPGSGS